MRKWIYVVGILALGIVIFNNVVQLAEAIKGNQNYLIGLIVALISSIIYGIINLK